MNLPKTVSWRACIFVLLAMAAFGTSLRGAPEPVDPLVGNWLWNQDHTVTIRSDGTAHNGGSEGTWQYLHNPEVQRHYRIIWDHGKYIDELACSEDGLRAHVRNQNGEQYNVRRALDDKPTASPAGPDPVVGDWLWFRNQPLTFHADGTATSPDGGKGTWEYLSSLGGGRKYRLTLANGKYVDDFTCSPDGETAHVISKTDAPYDVRRASPPTTAPDTVDPLIGEWRWLKNRKVVFKADGTMTASNGPQGVWEFLHNAQSERKYRLDWDHGKYIDNLSYNRTAQSAHVVNQSGEEYDVTPKGAATTPGKPADYFGTSN